MRFCAACGCAVAVANALPMVKADAEIVTSAPRGAGVVETVRRILEDDLAEIAPTIERQTIEIARDLTRRTGPAASAMRQRADRGHIRRRQVDRGDGVY